MITKKIPIAMAKGDGIGPEIMNATLDILRHAEAPLEIREIAIGENVYKKGTITGMDPSSWDIIRNTQAFLKAPITTPQGGGYKSLNVTIRTTLGLYANIRPCRSYFPMVHTKHPLMDVVIVRENEEDLYTGIEYQQTPNVAQSLKIISRQGCERIIRYAFAYARQYKRKKVTCFTKDNILKISDGMFHKVFDEVAKEYPDILHEHWIIDIGAAKLADTPEIFDVIVMPNLYGDILSDIAGQIAGSVGLVGSSNIGEKGAMFEAIHGSAPRRANQNLANPSALILASVMMLVHLNLPEIAENIHNAWLCALEEGVHTYDIFSDEHSKEKVGTKEFAQAVIQRLGKNPSNLEKITYEKNTEQNTSFTITPSDTPAKTRKLIGIDIYIYAHPKLGSFYTEISHINVGPLNVHLITNRGVKIWPEGFQETFCVDHWRIRFISKDGSRQVAQKDLIDLLKAVDHMGLDIIKTENLYEINGEKMFSSADI
jgi:isocitrate dehydrogenase